MRGKIAKFVSKGDFGLASGQKPDGSYERIWCGEFVGADEVTFETGVFLLTKAKAQSLKTSVKPEPPIALPLKPGAEVEPGLEPTKGQEPLPIARTFHIVGKVPSEVWNRLGTKMLPKLRSGKELQISIEFSVAVENDMAKAFESELRQILSDLGLADKVRVE